MNQLVTDLFFCLPAGVAALLFLCTVGGWGMKKRSP
jgi:hypothetical protein